MDYVSCAEAKPLKGLRLVLSVGAPNPWGEAAKNILQVRKVPFVAVGRVGMEEDAELLEWTGQPNVPVAMYDDEKPRQSWIEILYLAERLGSGQSLLPDTLDGQIECIGLSHQICGENGLGWERRLNIFHGLLAAAGGDPVKTGIPLRLFKDYQISSATAGAAGARLISILNLIEARLERQRSLGSSYLVGDRLTATDVHFASLLGMVDPLPHEVNPMPEGLRAMYMSGEPDLRAAVSDRLRAHRDFIYERHLQLPMDF